MSVFVSVSGGTGAGKTTLALQLQKALAGRCTVVPLDCFYHELENMPAVCRERPCADPKALNADEKADAFNMDRPESYDFDGLLAVLRELQVGKDVTLFKYDFPNYTLSTTDSFVVKAGGVVIVEGIQALANDEVNAMMDLRVFVDTPDDIRFMRRIHRDVEQRGRSLENLISHTIAQIKPMHDQFVVPCKTKADLILPTWPSAVGHQAIVTFCEHLLSKRGGHLSYAPNLCLAASLSTVRGLLTTIRDKSTERNRFVQCCDRLSRVVVEHCVGLISQETPQVVTTPVEGEYLGCSLLTRMCCISIVRSGEAIENAARDLHLRGLATGKMLFDFQSDQDEWQSRPGTPAKLIYKKLPPKIASYELVLVCDPVVGRGRAVLATVDAVKALGVPADRIVVATLISSRPFLATMAVQEPRVRVVAVDVDEEVSEGGYCVPGLGNFADRYFGTGKSSGQPLE